MVSCAALDAMGIRGSLTVCICCGLWLASNTLALGDSSSSSPPPPPPPPGGRRDPEWPPGRGDDGVLVPFLRMLMREAGGGDHGCPRKPDTKYLRYMRRLYTVSATQAGAPRRRAGHQYNTARLLSPRALPHQPAGEAFEQDVYYRLDFVMEDLLRSVLLYSVDKSIPFPVLCNCNLQVKDHKIIQLQTCSNAQRSHNFFLHLEGRKRHKWVEVDLTSFLQPFIGFHKGSLHMIFSYWCVRPDQSHSNLTRGRDGHGSPLTLSLMAPSLLLFLNDTRGQAHQRWYSETELNAHPRLAQVQSQAKDPSHQSQELVRRSSSRSVRQRRSPKRRGLVKAPQKVRSFPWLQHPKEECQLHDFRLAFSQLRWDRWIIAPHNYNPRFCRGSCPRALGHRYGSPVHTLVQNILYEKGRSPIPQPSCVPASYSPLSVLTLENDGSVIYKEYEDMIATACTCR